ncbi:D-tyrosyl-tRNA(Tyr) deacylase [Weissella kandleri]|uniref:D-aminoacyl-tRNA deacylase n=1 Tax=Weissella kandleri TaxID=1616 RepID=A0A0R2JMV8_9LACO|nr:D-tyrosyl-tRNA(Tyr) deacylase [Weissella kandleri]
MQRVLKAQVTSQAEILGTIQQGLVLFVGVGSNDTVEDVNYLVRKILNLRIFEDEVGKMNLNIQQVAGSILSISQFTLYADIKKGNRPNFMQAAEPKMANELYEKFNQGLRMGKITVATGRFGTDMQVDFVNDGPVTILLDSQNR